MGKEDSRRHERQAESLPAMITIDNSILFQCIICSAEGNRCRKCSIRPIRKMNQETDEW